MAWKMTELLSLQMAWSTKEEQVMDIVRKHMEGMSFSRKNDLAMYYSKAFFRHEQQSGWNNVRWTTRGGITFVTMWDEEHLYNNLRLAMIKEMMGVGPSKYCIINNPMPHFESRLLLLIHFLPHKKMCFYPPREYRRSLQSWTVARNWVSHTQSNYKCEISHAPYRLLYPTICSIHQDRVLWAILLDVSST